MKNKINLPSSGAGIVRYSGKEDTKFKLKPAYVIIFVILVIIIEAILWFSGNSLLGIPK